TPATGLPAGSTTRPEIGGIGRIAMSGRLALPSACTCASTKGSAIANPFALADSRTGPAGNPSSYPPSEFVSAKPNQYQSDAGLFEIFASTPSPFIGWPVVASMTRPRTLILE